MAFVAVIALTLTWPRCSCSTARRLLRDPAAGRPDELFDHGQWLRAGASSARRVAPPSSVPTGPSTSAGRDPRQPGLPRLHRGPGWGRLRDHPLRCQRARRRSDAEGNRTSSSSADRAFQMTCRPHPPRASPRSDRRDRFGTAVGVLGGTRSRSRWPTPPRTGPRDREPDRAAGGGRVFRCSGRRSLRAAALTPASRRRCASSPTRRGPGRGGLSRRVPAAISGPVPTELVTSPSSSTRWRPSRGERRNHRRGPRPKPRLPCGRVARAANAAGGPAHVQTSC